MSYTYVKYVGPTVRGLPLVTTYTGATHLDRLGLTPAEAAILMDEECYECGDEEPRSKDTFMLCTRRGGKEIMFAGVIDYSPQVDGLAYVLRHAEPRS